MNRPESRTTYRNGHCPDPLTPSDRKPLKPDISIIVPVYNEEESAPVLAREISDAFNSQPRTWECLWIDDGSSDGTLAGLRELHEREPRHHFVALKGNFGQSAAMAVGFRTAQGRILATLDGDLQNDPADLPRLVDELERSDVEMVNGLRARRNDSAVRRLSSKIANSFRNAMTGRTVTDVGCSLRVFYRECVEGIPLFKGMHRFFPTLVGMRGYRMKEMPVNHRPRTLGTAKYGINNRLWVGLYDTFGVRWYLKRHVLPQVATTSCVSKGETDA
ncbi:MAG: glycosyltransferase family 2 protein [bacterium]|nr:glycosyltransferase family 2 protein [bacterium]